MGMHPIPLLQETPTHNHSLRKPGHPHLQQSNSKIVNSNSGDKNNAVNYLDHQQNGNNTQTLQIKEIADHAIGSNAEGKSRLSVEDSVTSATESDSIGSIRNSSPDSQPSPPLHLSKVISEQSGSASHQTLLSRLSPRSCDFSNMVIPPPSSTPCQKSLMPSTSLNNNNNITTKTLNSERNVKTNHSSSHDNHSPPDLQSSDDKLGRLSPMVNITASPSRLHHLQALA